VKLPTGSHTLILVVLKIRHITSHIAKDAHYERSHVLIVTSESQSEVSNATGKFLCQINPLTPELNPYMQRYLTRFFTGDFAS
jgi:hypothetical protein